MTTKNIQDVAAERVEEIVDTVETVEFLHGVPVKLPSQYKADLRGKAREVLTQLVKEERERVGEELLRRVEGERTDERKVATFGDWQAETYEDKMLANAIIDTIKQHITKLTGVE